MQAQVADWRALLTESVEDGRTLLREVLTTPLLFTPTGEGYRFRATVKTGELVAGGGRWFHAHKVGVPRRFRRWLQGQFSSRGEKGC